MTKVVIGLMSGTSMDGVDAASLRTDGAANIEFLATHFVAYPPHLRLRLRAVLGSKPPFPADLEAQLTELHTDAAAKLLRRRSARLIGFPGHTITHDPQRRLSHRLGDCQAMADALGVAVVGDFRFRDMEAGGQGAPLAPLFHRQLFIGEPLPVAVVNLGGVANLTWLRAAAPVAADAGPGMALIDDWVATHYPPASFDKNGEMAKRGEPAAEPLARLLDDDWFSLPPPKSLDRQAFAAKTAEALVGLNDEDGLATLTAFTAAGVAKTLRLLSRIPPSRIILSGGGRKNRTLRQLIEKYAGCASVDIDDTGFNGDFLEAQAFAWLAMRHLSGEPFSLPTTTGCRLPTSGGILYRPASKRRPPPF